MSALSFGGIRAATLALVLVAGACAPGERGGRAAEAGASGPRRIVSLAPSSTEILVSLGALDRLVGRSRWDAWPDTVKVIPAIGEAIRPSVERIIALRPDLVVLYSAADNAAARQALGSAGIPVVSLRIDTIHDFLRAVDSLGVLVGAVSRADSITASLRAQLEAVRIRTLAVGRTRVFIPVWDEPLMTVGAGSFLSELVTLAGGENVYGDQPVPSLTVSWEDVVRRDPDVVLTGPTKAGKLRADPRWQALRAVREGRVLTYDTMLVSQPSTRMGEAARSLAELLHPAARR